MTTARPNIPKKTIFKFRKSPKNAKNLFDASHYAATTSDPIRVKNKNIPGLGPRDLIGLNSSWDRFPSWSKSRSRLPGGTSN
jgi:hypothetical protein